MGNPILDKLKGGSLISDGQADEVADEVLQHHDRFTKLKKAVILQAPGLLHNVSGTAIRTRAAKTVNRLENPMLPIPKGWEKK